MLGPKTDNKITDGDSNTQIGHNSGTITIGLTHAEFEASLEKRLVEKTQDLERAHGAEQTVLRQQIADLQSKLANIEPAYQQRLDELNEVKQKLHRYENQIDAEKLRAAYAALDDNETTLAEALFKQVLQKVIARRQDTEREEAEIEFEIGKIAEAEIRWHDAYTHYKRAAALDPTLDHLESHARMAWRLAKGAEAETLYTQLVTLTKDQFGDQSSEYAVQLNNLALVVHAQGRYPEAEALYHQALDIDRATIGEAHHDFAIDLNNLANVVRAQGRYPEAEALFRQALEIDRATIGEAHPDYATHLNNLAIVVKAQGRYPEAEALYRQALEIGRATIGEAHPNFAIRLNNLAGVVQAQGRTPEAEELYRQALEITRATIGEAHPDFAINLGNLGSCLADMGRGAEARDLLTQALDIFRAALPADHPHIAGTLRHLNALPPEN